MSAKSPHEIWSAPSGRAPPRTWLICHDLQREYVIPGRPLFDDAAVEVVSACDRVLVHGRSSRWRIVHTHRRRAEGLFGVGGMFAAPIEGLRPLITEPVFVREGLSAFSNPEFAIELRQARGGEVYMIGFSLSDSCLATALAAVDEGLRVTLVEDAIGAGPRARPGQIAQLCLEPWVRQTSSHSLAAEAQAVSP